jgi:hypothetical protein
MATAAERKQDHGAEAISDSESAEIGTTNERDREPPAWTPKAALATIPATIAAAAVAGAVDSRWAIVAIFLGLFLFLFLVCTWVADATLRGIIGSALTSVVFAGVITGGILLFAWLANETRPADVPTTTSQPTAQTAPVRPPAAAPPVTTTTILPSPPTT